MYNFFKPSHQVLLNKHFSERQQKFWHKKKPFSENYSFQTHDPFEIFGEDTKLTKITKHAKRHFWLNDVCTCHGLLPSHSA